MNTKQLMDNYDVSARTVQVWRRGYYSRKYKGVSERMYLMPDHSKVPCKWEKSPIRKLMEWHYTQTSVEAWIKKLTTYRKSRRQHAR